MAVQKLGAKTAPSKPEAAPAEGAGKKETKAPVKIDLNNLSKTYNELEAATKEKSATGVKSEELLAVVKEVFSETGKDELVLAPVANIVREKFGKKLYNQLRTAIQGKNSGYDLKNKDNGQVVIVKGKLAPAE